MNIFLFRKKLGRYRVFITRLMSYLSIFTFLMILKVFAEDEPLGMAWFVWLIIIGVFSVVLIVLDIKLVIEGEADYGFSKTPRWVAMEKNIEDILSILKEDRK